MEACIFLKRLENICNNMRNKCARKKIKKARIPKKKIQINKKQKYSFVIIQKGKYIFKSNLNQRQVKIQILK